MTEIKGPFNPSYIYDKTSTESCTDGIGNGQIYLQFMQTKQEAEVMCMDKNVKKARSSTKTAENSCARKMKTRTR